MDNKTIFNYIGGKTWLKEYLRKEVLNQLLTKQNIKNYCEPFAGGLGAFLNVADILLEHKIKQIQLNDINTKLINFYECVNHQKKELVSDYLLLETQYQKSLPQELKSFHRTRDQDKLKPLLKASNEYYIKIRKEFNQLSKNTPLIINEESVKPNIQLASLLLFLQNHCFNGVYRENLKGEHNTPYNWESKSFDYQKTITKIENVHQLFNQFDIKFTNMSFEKINFNQQTLYYLDPPYINEHITENKYHQEGFNQDLQLKLIQQLKNQHFIYSNHTHPLLLKEFEKEKINIYIQNIARKNIISASKQSRKEDKIELLISSQSN